MPDTYLDRAIADGHAKLASEGKTERIHYLAVGHSERWSDPEEKVCAEYWAELIYRYQYAPQAKRLMQRIERFRTVVLDFTGVASIGQAFADEVFRVFANVHPGVELVPMHATPTVQQMIRRAEVARDEGRTRQPT